MCRTLFASRVGYSILNLFWNLIVGFVVLSVCRTHTIGELVCLIYSLAPLSRTV